MESLWSGRGSGDVAASYPSSERSENGYRRVLKKQKRVVYPSCDTSRREFPRYKIVILPFSGCYRVVKPISHMKAADCTRRSKTQILFLAGSRSESSDTLDRTKLKVLRSVTTVTTAHMYGDKLNLSGNCLKELYMFT